MLSNRRSVKRQQGRAFNEPHEEAPHEPRASRPNTGRPSATPPRAHTPSGTSVFSADATRPKRANSPMKLTATIASSRRPPFPGGASHRTGLVLFTSGSSGRRVFTPAAGRLTTSRYPSGSKSCTGAMMC